MTRIDDYLTDLERRLRLMPEASRRLVEETQAHLQDAVEAEMASGTDLDTAEERALARFGTAHQVARAANGGYRRVVGPALSAIAQLVAVGCGCVIAGTLIAEVLSWATSTSWVFGPPSTFAPTAGQAAHWLHVQPSAQGWRQAAAAENASDSLLLRTGLGLIGLAAAGVLALVVRRQPRLGGGVTPIVGVTAFGGAAALLASGALSTLDWGRGQSLSDMIPALVAAGCYAVLCGRDLLVTGPTRSPQ